jgi:hypothetical protein
MSFRDFTLPKVLAAFDLELVEADLFSPVPPLPVREEFRALLAEASAVVMATSNEKARSEFFVAPLLLELRAVIDRKFGLFSGVEMNVDPERGLTGVCDFLLAKVPLQTLLRGPVAAVVETKDERLSAGYGQCVAEMVAVRLFNRSVGEEPVAVHGVVTSGNCWKFLRLTGRSVTLDTPEYYVDNPGKIMGILRAILMSP